MKILDNNKQSINTLEDSHKGKQSFIEVNIQYQVYPQRWLILFAFCCLTFTSSMAFVQYSPILKLAASYYQVSEMAIVWMSSCYYIAYFYCAPFAIKPLEKRLDLSLFLSALLTAIGGWIKYLAEQNYTVAFIGFALVGLGQTWILAAPAYISDKWFASHERTLATSIGTFLNYLGMNFALIYTSLKFEQEENYEEITNMNLVFAIMNSVAFLMCLLFVKDKPKRPPSYTAIAEKYSILYSYKQIFTKVTTVLDLTSISMFIGASWCYLIVASILLEPYHYTQKQIGYVSLCYSSTGSIGGTLASIYVDYKIKYNQKPNYDLFIKSFISFGFLGILLEALVIDYNISDTWIIILAGIIGFGLNSFLPLAAQGFIEKLYPAFELVLVTAIMQSANLFGFILSYVLVIDSLKDFGLWMLIIILSPFYVYMLLFYKTKFARQEQQTYQIVK